MNSLLRTPTRVLLYLVSLYGTQIQFNSEAPVNGVLRKVESATAMRTYVSFPIPMIIIIDYVQDVEEIRNTINTLVINTYKYVVKSISPIVIYE